MAEQIELQAYLEELNHLVEQEALEEAIGHCRFILQQQPKNLAVYRVLGEALLRKEQHEEAIDIFSRVLSAAPEDFFSLLGLSMCYEAQNQLDRAIGYMVRAYEREPNDADITAEVRRLYGARDGEEPAKVQLTRGALARIYTQGQLYEQAIAELQDALRDNPARADLRILLAETLWRSEYPIEAAEVAAEVLQKLPDCLDANRILAQFWLNSGRDDQAGPFLARIADLDPWAAHQIGGNGADFEPIMLDKLEWNAATAAALSAETPDWIGELDSLLGQPAPAAPVAEATTGDAGDWAEVSDEVDWFSDEQGAEISGELDEPDWAADIGEPDWLSDDDVGDMAALSDELSEPDWAADIDEPDWFGEEDADEFADVMAGDSDFENVVEESAELDWSEVEGEPDWAADIGDPDWMSEEEPVPAADAESAPDWLSDGGGDLDWMSEEEPVAAVDAEPAPDWLSDGGGDLDWMSEEEPVAIADAEPAQQPEMTSEEGEIGDPLAWMSELGIKPKEQPVGQPEPFDEFEDEEVYTPASGMTSNLEETPDSSRARPGTAELQQNNIEADDSLPIAEEELGDPLAWMDDLGIETDIESAVSSSESITDEMIEDEPPVEQSQEGMGWLDDVGAGMEWLEEVGEQEAQAESDSEFEEFEPKSLQAEPEPLQAEPIQAEPEAGMGWLDDVGDQPEPDQAEPIQAEPEASMGWLDDVGDQPEPVQAEPIQAEPEASMGWLDDVGDQPEPDQAEPEPLQAEPELVQAEPEAFDADSESLEAVAEPEIQPASSGRRSLLGKLRDKAAERGEPIASSGAFSFASSHKPRWMRKAAQEQRPEPEPDEFVFTTPVPSWINPEQEASGDVGEAESFPPTPDVVNLENETVEGAVHTETSVPLQLEWLREVAEQPLGDEEK